MTLRTRLAALSALILIIAVVAVGTVLSQSARKALIDPIDRRLIRIGEDFVSIDRRIPPFAPQAGGAGPGGADTRPEGRDTAVLRFVDGTLDGSSASGFDSDPDPLPVVPAAQLADLELGTWRLVDLSSADGEVNFRAVEIAVGPDSDTQISASGPRVVGIDSSAQVTAGGQRVVYLFAQPLTSVEASVDRLRFVALIAGLVAVAVGGVLTWMMVRHSFKPVDETIAIAAQIGSGDLSLRVPEPAHPAELHSLGRSINTMLSGIERSQQAETAARTALTQFVADASHELRTPIAAISGHAELIASGALDPEGAGRSVERIAAESLRMQRLVDDLLVLASHDTGHRQEFRVVNLSDIVTDAVEDGRAIDAGRTYRSNIEPEIRVLGDEARLQQVIANLLANVRCHTPSATTASIVVGHDGECALVVVADDGPGIPDAQRPHLFERFYRSRSSSPQRAGGAGLGLAIVSAIVDEHHGTVEVHSAEGETRFEVRLPIATTEIGV
jgi:two-component system OmpR family sensor kinase